MLNNCGKSLCASEMAKILTLNTLTDTCVQFYFQTFCRKTSTELKLRSDALPLMATLPPPIMMVLKLFLCLFRAFDPFVITVR